jgi:hypothetical protein
MSSSEDKPDWSRVESIVKSGKFPLSPKPENAPGEALVPVEQQGLPTPLAAMTTKPKLTEQGLLMQWKAGKLDRKVTLAALESQYDGQLDVLRETITQAVKVQKTKVGMIAEEYLKNLDAKHLEVLEELGIRNVAKRWKAVTDLNDMAVSKINEVQTKKWPDSLIDETIAQILATRKRVVGEILKELGSEYESNAKAEAE